MTFTVKLTRYCLAPKSLAMWWQPQADYKEVLPLTDKIYLHLFFTTGAINEYLQSAYGATPPEVPLPGLHAADTQQSEGMIHPAYT